jgi:hypothetical protein
LSHILIDFWRDKEWLSFSWAPLLEILTSYSGRFGSLIGKWSVNESEQVRCILFGFISDSMLIPSIRF